MRCVLLLLLTVLGIVPDYYGQEWSWQIVPQKWHADFVESVYRDAVDVNEISAETVGEEYIAADGTMILTAIPVHQPPDPNNPTSSIEMVYFKATIVQPELTLRYWEGATMYHLFSYCIYNNKDFLITSTIPDGKRPCRNCYRILKRYEEDTERTE